ncbi:MAG: nucleoside-diphosphate sugar epimerase [Sphingobacteriaceae bacterium]|nr:MAG: nucleoside-diphosphate sugar epimerase [Sphingobacteriaceae bacterium]
MQYKAVIAGASGLIGNLLLNHLLNHPDYIEVLVLVRQKLNLEHQKLRQLAVDFDNLNNYENEINGYAIFCCLGTTKSKTPDSKIYRKIDHDYPIQLAKIAAKNSIQQFHLVSALGADAASSFFYNKLKGETEQDIKQVEIPAIYIYQPSLLTGDRKEKRLAERFATGLFKLIDPLLIGSLNKYSSIPANTVATAMLNQSLKNNFGIFTYPSDQIKKLT